MDSIEEEEDNDLDAGPPVTAREAKKMRWNGMEILLMQKDNENSLTDKLYEYFAHFINQIYTDQLTQFAITSYCIPSTSKQ